MRWPWQRSEERKPDAAPLDAASSAAVTSASERTVPPAGWAFLPPLQRQISDAAPTAMRPAFVATLPTRVVPASLGTMGHLVDPDAPSGTISVDDGALGAPLQRTVTAELSLRHPLIRASMPARQTQADAADAGQTVQRDAPRAMHAAEALPPVRPVDAGAGPVEESPDSPDGSGGPPEARDDSGAPPEVPAAPPEPTGGDISSEPLPVAPTLERRTSALGVAESAAREIPPPVAASPLAASVPRRTASGPLSPADHRSAAAVQRTASVEQPGATPVVRQRAEPAASPTSNVPPPAPADTPVQHRPGLGAPLAPPPRRAPESRIGGTLDSAPLGEGSPANPGDVPPAAAEAGVLMDSGAGERPAGPAAVPVETDGVPRGSSDVRVGVTPPVIQRDLITAATHGPGDVSPDPAPSPDSAPGAPLAPLTWVSRLGADSGQRHRIFPLRTVPTVAARTIDPAISPRPLGAAIPASRATRIVAARVIAPGASLGQAVDPSTGSAPGPGSTRASVSTTDSGSTDTRSAPGSGSSASSSDHALPAPTAAATASGLVAPAAQRESTQAAAAPATSAPARLSVARSTAPPSLPESSAAASSGEPPSTAGPSAATVLETSAATVLGSSAGAATWVPGWTTTRSVPSTIAARAPVQRAFGLPTALPSRPSAPDLSSLAPSIPSLPSAPDLSSPSPGVPDLPSADELRSRAAEAVPEATDAARSASATLTQAGQALSPVAGGAGATSAATENVEQLVRKLYGPLVRRIRAELLLDRERRGIRIDGI